MLKVNYLKGFIMSRFTITIILAAAVLSGGCLEMATPANIATTQQKMATLTESVDAYQQSVAVLGEQLAKDKLISDKTAADIGAINTRIDEIQPVVEDAVTAVLEAEYSGDKFRDVVTGVAAANKATAAVNPYAPMVDAGTKLLLGLLSLGTAGGVVIARKKSAEAAEEESKGAESQAKYTAHKQATEQVKLAHPEIAAELYAKVGDARAKLGI